VTTLISVTRVDNQIKPLKDGPEHAFADWPVQAVPDVAAGVYAIWNHAQLIYVGMSGRGATERTLDEKRSEGKRFGLFNRLSSHASGRRSGDQFCVYVADFLVLPQLSKQQVNAISERELSFDNVIRDYIHEHLTFRFMETSDGKEALRIEAELKAGALGQKPLLNPDS
jgi:hypothetical protein